MSSKCTLWIFVIVFLVVGVTGNGTPAHAQTAEKEVTVTEQFTIPAGVDGLESGVAAAGADTACEITAELQWHRKKNVKVGYRWHGCPQAHTIRWELVSIHNAGGNVTTDVNDGFNRVYNESWPDLTDGDQITLRTWIDGERQADVATEYRDKWPIWARIHTRADDDGACFRFSGRVDPWGVFTAGDYTYRFELSADEWETPWLVGPDEPTVDWHVAFYRDAELTKLRSEYWFNDVENPCHTPPSHCEAIALSVEIGTLIPVAGVDVDVTVIGHNGTQYRIVDTTEADATKQVVAGPSADNTLQFHAMPNTTYQAQVFNERHGWTDEGCTFAYGEDPKPVCNGVDLSIDNGAEIPATGASVQATVHGEFGTLYRIMDSKGNLLGGPDTSPTFSFTAVPGERYQAHVFGEQYGWTQIDPAGDVCAFAYVAEPIVSCLDVTLSVDKGSVIPDTGLLVDGSVQAIGTERYRIMDLTTDQEMIAPTNAASFQFHVLPFHDYQAQVPANDGSWTTVGCGFSYISAPTPPPPYCIAVALMPDTTSAIPESGTTVHAAITAQYATQYQIVEKASGKIVVPPGTETDVEFTAYPAVAYQAQVRNSRYEWMSATDCDFDYPAEPEPVTCLGVQLSLPSGSPIPDGGTDVTVTINGLNSTSYRIMGNGEPVTTASNNNVFTIHALPDVTYQGQVSKDGIAWTNQGCNFVYGSKPVACMGVNLSIEDGKRIPAAGATLDVKIAGENSSEYQIVDMESGAVMAGPSASAQLHLHAMPEMRYQAQVRNSSTTWVSAQACAFGFGEPPAVQALCSLNASHYGDPGGLSRITAWIEEESADGWVRRAEPTAITAVVVNWDNHGTVTYPTAEQAGPWVTNQPFDLNSRPEVHDVGFGYYLFEAWVKVAGIAEPAYCQGDGNAPDHDNVIPDPGPFAADNPEGKFVRSDTPSRLPTVGRVPFDAGNGPDRVELILWAFEKKGRGINARITGIANEGKPLARLGMSSVTDFVKFDGLNAREGIVYGFQISEHGPWSPLFCPKPDSNPTTITIYWGAGGQTWLSDWAAYGDCWWLTVAAALNGWVTVDEQVATYNALQPVIDWNGHRNLVFSLAQDRETGLGPRMQDAVIGLQAREWQGPVVPETVPEDFNEMIAAQQSTQ